MKIFRAMVIAFSLAAIQFCSSAMAQDGEIIPKDIMRLQAGGLDLIDDLQTSSSSTAISVTNENGVKTTKVVDGKNRLTIVEDPASGITCKVTKTYGPEELAKLEEEQPELFMHLSSIPKTVGESQIEISVGVTTTYTAADASELKAKHADVYKLYHKYTNEQNLGRIHLRMGRPLRLRLGLDGAQLQQPDDDDDAEVDDDDSGDESDDEDDDDSDDGEEDDGDGR